MVALHDALCFKDTDMDGLEEGKISTIFLNEFASFQENDSFSRLECIYFLILYGPLRLVLCRSSRGEV